jgi:flagellar hook-length control protein FliK
MTGLTLPASTSAALPGKVAAPSLLAIGTPGDAGPGVPSLAAFVDLMAGKADVTGKPGGGDGERQDDAATGNVLPDQAESSSKDGSDPALAWLLSVPPIALPPVDPSRPVAAGGPASDGAIAATGNDSADKGATPALPLPPAPIAGNAPQPVADVHGAPTVEAAPAAPIPVAVDGAAAAPVTVTSIAAATTAALAAPVPAVAAAPTVPAAPPAIASQTVEAKPAPATDASAAPAQTAAQPIRIALSLAASAMPAIAAAANKPMPALFALAMVPDRERSAEPDRDNAGGAAIVAATLLSPTDAAALVAQPGEAQRQALDMGRQDWPQKMIDRIEALRDDANANDTSIRLKPEALGQVDVALRTHADGAVSVHFTAEQPATRTLIADAAPQLNAAAEARGIRLAGTSVDLSGSGMADGNRQRPQFAAPQNKTNPVSAARGDDIQAVADGRIA